MDRHDGYWAQLRQLYRQNRRLVLLVGAIAFAVGFVGGSLFILQQASTGAGG